MSQDFLDYDILAKAYMENLYTNLRNFKVGPDFLETWVHDEDHNQSIYGIFEAAECAKVTEIALKVSSTVAKNLDLEWLEKEVRHLGNFEINKNSDGGLLLKARFRDDERDLQIHPVYKAAIAREIPHIHNEGALSAASDGQTLVSAEVQGTKLQCLVDADRKVLAAKHRGASGLFRVLLDQLCDVMIGRPIQEANDHGVIRLEYKLRDPGAEAPVKGILTPENADPAFKLPQTLVRALFADYVKQTKMEVKRNFWDDGASSAWMSLDDDERIERVRPVLAAACRELGLQEVGVEVVAIKDHVRVVIAYTQNPHMPSFGNAMIKLERALRERIDSRLELQLESLEDKNKRKERMTARNKGFKH